MISKESADEYLKELEDRRDARLVKLIEVTDLRDMVADMMNCLETLYIIISATHAETTPQGFVPLAKRSKDVP